MKTKIILGLLIFGIITAGRMSNVPTTHAESMGFYLASVAGSTDGRMSTDIEYRSDTLTDTLNRNIYDSENHGMGGELTTIQTLETPVVNSGDISATQTTQLLPSATSNLTYVKTKEIAATGRVETIRDDEIGIFQAAVGVGENVSEGLLTTETWTNQGAAGQVIGASYGTGYFESGAVATYLQYQGITPHGGAIWPGWTPSDVTETANQHVDYDIDQHGQWTYTGTHVLYPPTITP